MKQTVERWNKEYADTYFKAVKDKKAIIPTTIMFIRKLIKQQLKANDDKWKEKIRKAMGKDEKETFNHTYTTLSGGISNIRVEAFTRNCFRKHIKKSLKENK